MKFDDLINQIIDLKSSQGIENYDFDPTYIVIMQTASIIGMNFNINTLFKLIPVDLQQSKLLHCLHDLSELNVFME